MDPTRFDGIAIAVGRRATRRVILTALTRATAGATLAGLVAVPGSEEAAAGTCRELFVECTSARECCGHKKKKRICALNEHSGAPTEPSCCIPDGKRCEFGGQCCGTLTCRGAAGEGRCGV